MYVDNKLLILFWSKTNSCEFIVIRKKVKGYAQKQGSATFIVASSSLHILCACYVEKHGFFTVITQFASEKQVLWGHRQERFGAEL